MLTLLLLLNAAFAGEGIQVAVGAPIEAYRRLPPPPPPHYRRRPPPPPPVRARVAVAPAPARVVETDNNVSLTMSPLHLAVNTVEAQAEFRVSPQFSLAMLGGVGGMDGEGLYEIGGQARGYVSGDFDRGVNLGMEVRYGNVDLYGPTEPGLAMGPFLGGKYTFDEGLTLEAQLGGQYIQGADYRAVAPIANFNIGWSF